MKNKGGGVEMTLTPIPMEIRVIVAELYKVCVLHNIRLDIPQLMEDTIGQQAKTIAAQRAVIADLEQRLGIDQEL